MIDTIKNISIQEMKHAQSFAERLKYLGGIPKTKPAPIEVGESVRQMLAIDKKSELDAIQLYKSDRELAEQENDPTTRRFFETILAAEEEHCDFFTRVLE